MAQLEGMDDVLQALRNLLPAPDEVNKVLTPFAEDVADEMRSRVPVDQGVVKNAIGVIKRKKAQYVDAGIDYKKLNNKRPSNIGYLLEYGFVHKGGKQVQPQPFIRPSFEACKDRILKGMSEAFSQLLTKKWEGNKS